MPPWFHRQQAYAKHRAIWYGALFSAGIGLLFYFAAAKFIEGDIQKSFTNHARTAQNTINARIKSYTDVLRGTASLFSTIEPVTREQFREYVQGLDVRKHFPAIETINYAQYLRHEELPAFELRMRAEQQDGIGRGIHLDPATVDLERRLDRQEGQVRGLRHGRDDGLGLDHELGALDRHRGAAARCVRFAQAVADELDAHDLAVLAQYLDGARQELHPDSLALRLAELLLVDDELGAGAPVRDRHVIRAVAQAGARAIHGGIPTTDDHDVGADLERLAEVRLLHEVDAVVDPIELGARDIQGDGVHGPGGDGDRVVVLLELLEGDVLADGRVVDEPDAQALDQANVHLDGLARQAEGGDADEHRAAGERQAVEDGDAVALGGQFACDGDTRRTGADHGHALRPWRDPGHDVRDTRGLVPLDEEALHGPDGERAIDVAATARPFARRGADVRAHRRDRVRLARQDVALLEPPFGGEVQVAAAVRPDRTRFLALDVALQPGGVDRLDEEFLGGIDGQAGTCLSEACRARAQTKDRRGPPTGWNLPPALPALQSATLGRRRWSGLTLPSGAATLATGMEFPCEG